MIRRSRSWHRPGMLVTLLALLAGCTVASPVDVAKDAAISDVRVVAQIDVESTQVRVTYRVQNTLAETAWILNYPSTYAVDPAFPAVSAVPDGTGAGVALAMVFFPVRGDVNYAQLPAASVVALAPHATLEGTVMVGRPFVPFSDLEGDKAVSLPSSPKSVQLCVGYVPASTIPAGQEPKTGPGDTLTIYRATAFPLQRIACSEPTPLG